MNLETKFSNLETQLAQQHQATMIAINALLTALGAPPPEPGATLVDVLGALNQIAVELSSLTTAIAAQHAAQLLKLTDIWTTLDLLNNNNALNTQLLLTALAANNCCTPTNPALPLPLLTNPTSLADEAKCRRIQFYLAWFGSWIDNIANFGGLGATLTGATLSTLLTTAIPAGTVVGGEIGAAGGIPGAVIGAILGLLISAAYALGSALFGTLSTQWHTAPLYDQLLHALYQANDAASGYAAFQATVSASGVLNPVWKGVINALFWTGWANDIYSSTPVVDDSGFDGSICAPAQTAGCFTPASGEVRVFAVTNTLGGQHASYTAVVWPTTFASRAASYAGHRGGAGDAINIVADNGELFVLHQDIFGYWSRGGTIYTNDEIAVAAGGSWTQITQHTTTIFVFPDVPGMAFTLCPPTSPPVQT